MGKHAFAESIRHHLLLQPDEPAWIRADGQSWMQYMLTSPPHAKELLEQPTSANTKVHLELNCVQVCSLSTTT